MSIRFGVETIYDKETLTAMAKAVRKTTRKKRSSRSHKLGIIITIIGFLFVAMAVSKGEVSANTVVTAIAVLVMALALIFEDNINGYIAGKRMLTGTEKSNVVFYDDCFVSTTQLGETKFNYDIVKQIAKTKNHLIFVLSTNHAQAYDLRGMTNGTAEKFCDFISEKTGINLQKI